MAGGVASSWQASPPHAIFIERGDGSRIWDIDGNEYVDYHLGYGAMVVGHAHPAIVEAIERQVRNGTHFAQPTKHLDAIGANLAERFSLPLWRFCNSGTEATLEAARLMRAKTGRDLLIKIEGTYHGHHDSLMFSVIPDPELMGPRDHPVTVPQAPGIPQAFADLVVVVPFNDLAAARQAFEEHRGEVAGMIVEPAMMNCGVILPEPGYLQGLADLCHEFGAYLAFDEVKTGVTLAAGGAVEAFGVVPDIVCLAKAIGGGTPCGAVGATEELFALVVDGEYDMAGTFNGNPLTMAAMHATLTEVLTEDAYRTLNHLDGYLQERLSSVIERYRLPGVRHRHGGQGVRDLFDPAGARVPRLDRHRRAHHLPRVAVPAERRRVQVAVGQAGDVDAFGPAHGRGRAALRRQRRGVRAGRHLLARSRAAAEVRPSRLGRPRVGYRSRMPRTLTSRCPTAERSRRSTRATRTGRCCSSTTAAPARRCRSSRSTARPPSAGSGW